jgi:hypothetical protein
MGQPTSGQPTAPYPQPGAAQPYPGGPYGPAQPLLGPPAGPPPQSRRGLAIALTVLGVVAVLVVGGTIALVTTQVGGKPGPGPTLAGPSSDPSGGPSAGPTGGPSDPPTSVAAPTCSNPGARELVNPAGAPYTYRVPDCFQTTTEVTQGRQAGDAKYETGLLPTGKPGTDLIIVSVYELTRDSDTLSDSEVKNQLDSLVGKLSGKPAATPDTRTVAGARAWRYTVELTGSTADSWFLFTGTTEVQVLCQWTTSGAKGQIEAGCQQVLDSLTISS